MSTVGQRIAQARKQKGMSQSTLAGALGISVQAVSQWENDKSSPTARLTAISDVLGADRSWLAGIQVNAHQNITISKINDDLRIPILEIDEASFLGVFHNSTVNYRHIPSVHLDGRREGRLFAIRASEAVDPYAVGDLLIFDSGVQAQMGDVAAVLVVKSPMLQFSNADAKDVASVVAAVGQLDLKKGEDGETLMRVGRQTFKEGLLIVGTMVERRTYRQKSLP